MSNMIFLIVSIIFIITTDFVIITHRHLLCLTTVYDDDFNHAWPTYGPWRIFVRSAKNVWKFLGCVFIVRDIKGVLSWEINEFLKAFELLIFVIRYYSKPKEHSTVCFVKICKSIPCNMVIGYPQKILMKYLRKGIFLLLVFCSWPRIIKKKFGPYEKKVANACSC